MQLKKIKDLELNRHRVILRVDYNVPMNEDIILDDFKIRDSLATIKYLLKKKCQIVLITHLGRPEGKIVPAMSLEPVYARFKRILAPEKVSSVFIKDKLTPELVTEINKLEQQIIFLENIRFYPGEEKNTRPFSELLSTLGEFFVNEAFAVSHRKSASIVGITDFLPCAAGLALEREVNYFSKAIQPIKPAIALMGGIKVETKLPIIKKLLPKYNYVLTGGGLGNTLLRAKGYDVGGTKVETKMLAQSKEILKSKRLILPSDVVIGDIETKKFVKVMKIGSVKVLCSKNQEILDIGPKTILEYSKIIKTAKTIVWNGPVGMIELKKYSHGSLALAKMIGARVAGQAVGIAGGGETTAVIDAAGVTKYFDFISAGGGAMLEFLQGKKLPGIEVLVKR